MILLDTNVLSEMMLPRPAPAVVRWMDQQPRLSVWTTTVNVFEIRAGLLAIPAGKQQTELQERFERILSFAIQGRLVSFDRAAAEAAAELHARGLKKGRSREYRDTMIAGIVLASHATLATRNVKHFEDIAKSVVNPWEG
jgi:predicted nucleic acid-binding protein